MKKLLWFTLLSIIIGVIGVILVNEPVMGITILFILLAPLVLVIKNIKNNEH